MGKSKVSTCVTRRTSRINHTSCINGLFTWWQSCIPIVTSLVIISWLRGLLVEKHRSSKISGSSTSYGTLMVVGPLPTLSRSCGKIIGDKSTQLNWQIDAVHKYPFGYILCCAGILTFSHAKNCIMFYGDIVVAFYNIHSIVILMGVLIFTPPNPYLYFSDCFCNSCWDAERVGRIINCCPSERLQTAVIQRQIFGIHNGSSGCR